MYPYYIHSTGVTLSGVPLGYYQLQMTQLLVILDSKKANFLSLSFSRNNIMCYAVILFLQRIQGIKYMKAGQKYSIACH